MPFNFLNVDENRCNTTKFDTRQSEQTALEFHRLARVWPHFRWWTPISVCLWSMLAYLGIWLTTALLGLVLVAVRPLRYKDMPFGKLSEHAELSNPRELALALMIIVVLLPAVFIGARWARVSPLGLLSSVEMLKIEHPQIRVRLDPRTLKQHGDHMRNATCILFQAFTTITT